MDLAWNLLHFATWLRTVISSQTLPHTTWACHSFQAVWYLAARPCLYIFEYGRQVDQGILWTAQKEKVYLPPAMKQWSGKNNECFHAIKSCPFRYLNWNLNWISVFKVKSHPKTQLALLEKKPTTNPLPTPPDFNNSFIFHFSGQKTEWKMSWNEFVWDKRCLFGGLLIIPLKKKNQNYVISEQKLQQFNLKALELFFFDPSKGFTGVSSWLKYLLETIESSCGLCVKVSLRHSFSSGHTRISPLLLARSDYGLQDWSIFNTKEKEDNSIVWKWKFLQT